MATFATNNYKLIKNRSDYSSPTHALRPACILFNNHDFSLPHPAELERQEMKNKVQQSFKKQQLTNIFLLLPHFSVTSSVLVRLSCLRSGALMSRVTAVNYNQMWSSPAQLERRQKRKKRQQDISCLDLGLLKQVYQVIGVKTQTTLRTSTTG